MQVVLHVKIIYKNTGNSLYRIAKDSLLVILYNGFFFICQL